MACDDVIVVESLPRKGVGESVMIASCSDHVYCCFSVPGKDVRLRASIAHVESSRADRWCTLL